MNIEKFAPVNYRDATKQKFDKNEKKTRGAERAVCVLPSGFASRHNSELQYYCCTVAHIPCPWHFTYALLRRARCSDRIAARELGVPFEFYPVGKRARRFFKKALGMSFSQDAGDAMLIADWLLVSPTVWHGTRAYFFCSALWMGKFADALECLSRARGGGGYDRLSFFFFFSFFCRCCKYLREL